MTKDKCYFEELLRNRVEHQNKNNLIGVWGETGSSKSLSSIKLCEGLDSDFNIDRIVFDEHEFMALVNSGKLHKGSAIVMDEGGMVVDSRKWLSNVNSLITGILQIFRRENLTVFFCAPDLSFLDKRARLLFHFGMESQYIDRKRNRAHFKVFRVRYNPRYRKMFFSYPVVDYKGEPTPITSLSVGLPSSKLLEKYEVKKEAYVKRRIAKVTDELKRSNAEIKVRLFEPDSIAETVLKDPSKYVKKWGKRDVVNLPKIMHDFKLGRPNAKIVRTIVEDSLIK